MIDTRHIPLRQYLLDLSHRFHLWIEKRSPLVPRAIYRQRVRERDNAARAAQEHARAYLALTHDYNRLEEEVGKLYPAPRFHVSAARDEDFQRQVEVTTVTFDRDRQRIATTTRLEDLRNGLRSEHVRAALYRHFMEHVAPKLCEKAVAAIRSYQQQQQQFQR
jgi:hypothetical protein